MRARDDAGGVSGSRTEDRARAIGASSRDRALAYRTPRENDGCG